MIGAVFRIKMQYWRLYQWSVELYHLYNCIVVSSSLTRIIEPNKKFCHWVYYVGYIFGWFECLELYTETGESLGEGSFGHVRTYVHNETRKEYAVKVLVHLSVALYYPNLATWSLCYTSIIFISFCNDVALILSH